MPKKELTAERLRELLNYDAETGVFRWRCNRPRGAKAGQQAGSRHPDGYVKVGVDGREYLAHRLAWLYMTGKWPSRVDHKDTDPANNAWGNLRQATDKQAPTAKRVREVLRSVVVLPVEGPLPLGRSLEFRLRQSRMA